MAKWSSSFLSPNKKTRICLLMKQSISYGRDGDVLQERDGHWLLPYARGSHAC